MYNNIAVHNNDYIVMETIDSIINSTLDSFDFGLVIVINIATYIINKVISEIYKSNVFIKRCVLICVSLILGIFYHFMVGDDKLILNSVILAPVFWSWIGKPVAKKFNADYNKNLHC